MVGPGGQQDRMRPRGLQRLPMPVIIHKAPRSQRIRCLSFAGRVSLRQPCGCSPWWEWRNCFRGTGGCKCWCLLTMEHRRRLVATAREGCILVSHLDVGRDNKYAVKAVLGDILRKSAQAGRGG